MIRTLSSEFHSAESAWPGRAPPRLAAAWSTHPTLQEPAVFDRILPLLVLAVSVLSVTWAVPAEEPTKKAASVLAFQVNDIDGKAVDLAKYKGDVLLIVNTASQCGH